MVFNNPMEWSKWLHLAEFWYNTNYHQLLKSTPFEALYGIKPPQAPLGSLGYSTQTPARACIAQRQQMLQHLRDNLLLAQSRMKFYANRKRSERTLQVVDKVYLKLQPYRQSSVEVRRNLKLCAKYYGPYEVLEKIGSVAYCLQLPPGSQVHPVFHVYQLKRRVGPDIISQQQPPACDSAGRVMMEPLAILRRRLVHANNTAVVQVLVHWANLSAEEATWEDWSYIRSRFPQFVSQN